MAGKPKAKVGDRYGYLTLIRDTGERKKHGEVVWECRCDCGKVIIRGFDSLMESVRHGHTISCGCQKDKSIGKRFAYDPERIAKARKSLGQIEGTTMQGIDRKSMNKNNKSGVRGVCFKQKEQKWQADLMLRGKSMDRKHFDTKEEAIRWRKHLEEIYYEPIKERYKELKSETKR